MANAFRIIIALLIFMPVFSSWAGQEECRETVKQATACFYFDIATGHKYIQNSDGTYMEFSKKGDLLKNNLPNTMPLLVSGKYIRPLADGCFLLYERYEAGNHIQKVLPADQNHPGGWLAKDVLALVP